VPDRASATVEKLLRSLQPELKRRLAHLPTGSTMGKTGYQGHAPVLVSHWAAFFDRLDHL
jgi:hypothetical protein